MLVLTRREGESIVIDTPQGRVTLTFVRRHSGEVILAFDAPRHIPIFRSEIQPPKEAK